MHVSEKDHIFTLNYSGRRKRKYVRYFSISFSAVQNPPCLGHSSGHSHAACFFELVKSSTGTAAVSDNKPVDNVSVSPVAFLSLECADFSFSTSPAAPFEQLTVAQHADPAT
jgi:hypothetical protein